MPISHSSTDPHPVSTTRLKKPPRSLPPPLVPPFELLKASVARRSRSRMRRTRSVKATMEKANRIRLSNSSLREKLKSSV
jgi:hypothetical protein